MDRPTCVTRREALERPFHLKGEGVRSLVWALSKATGMTQMGVSLRQVDPGYFGTRRHFHTVEEEWTYVLSGEGHVRIGPHRLAVCAGTFVGFPPGPRPHHFAASGTEPLLLLEGGERRPDEDSGWYVDGGLVWGPNRQFEVSSEAPPEEEGDPSQCVAVGAQAQNTFQHEVDVRATREYVSLHTLTGLARQAVRFTRVAAGDRTTAYHTHDFTDEWLYLLEGRARARVGSEQFEVGPGDFLGHPAGGDPHVMEPITDLTYLMGGQSDPEDVVRYPEAGKLRIRGKIVPAT